MFKFLYFNGEIITFDITDSYGEIIPTKGKQITFDIANSKDEFERIKAKKEKEGYTVVQYHNEFELAEIIKNRK